MYDINDILARLAKGEKPDAIAKEFTDALNGAIAEQQKQAEELARKRHAEEVRTCHAQTVITAVCDLLEQCYPELYDADMRKITAAEVLKTLDDMLQLADAFGIHKPITFSLDTLPLKKEDKKSDVIRSADALQEFLRKNNLI